MLLLIVNYWLQCVALTPLTDNRICLNDNSLFASCQQEIFSLLPATSILDYYNDDVEPRLKALQRVAAYFREPVQTMFLEIENPTQDDQNNYDVQMYCYWEHMTEAEKQKTIAFIQSMRKSKP